MFASPVIAPFWPLSCAFFAKLSSRICSVFVSFDLIGGTAIAIKLLENTKELHMKTSFVTRNTKKPRSMIFVTKDKREILIQKLGAKWYVFLGDDQYLVTG